MFIYINVFYYYYFDFPDCFSPPYMQNAVVVGNHWLENRDVKDRSDYRSGESITMTCRPGFADAKRKYTTVACVGNRWKYEKLDCQSNFSGIPNYYIECI